MLRFILSDHTDERSVKNGVDARGDRRHEVDQSLVKMLSEPQSLKIDFLSKARHIEPHGKISDHGGCSDDDYIKEQVVLFLYEQEHQHYTDEFAGRVLGHRILELLHPGEKPGDVEHGRKQPHGQDKIDHFILRGERDKDKPDDNTDC